MLRLGELLGLCLFVGVACFGVFHWRTSRPTLVTGTVIDLATSKPVAHATIRFRYLSTSYGNSLTDSNGHFSTEGVPAGRQYFVLVEHPQYAGILGTKIGKSITLASAGQHETDLIVPAIPGGEISGQIFDDMGRPVGGCPVTAFTPKHAKGPLELEWRIEAQTNGGGAYRFINVDADSYYLFAECDKLMRGETQNSYGTTSMHWRRRMSWLHVLYPDGQSVERAKAVVVLPGPGGLASISPSQRSSLLDSGQVDPSGKRKA